MSLKTVGTIAIPGAAGSEFDHAAFDAKSRRVFIAHTARDCVEVIDHDAGRHLATLPGFPGVAGAVADDGQILVTSRGGASAAWLGDDTQPPQLQLFGLSDHRRVSIELPGRPRWCVTDATASRVFLCIREPSMV